MPERQEHANGSSNTFLLGVFVGVLATLLLTTKKGRKLLKVIMDEGVDRIEKWEDMVVAMQEKVEEEAALDSEPVVGEDLGEEVKAIAAPEPVVEPKPVSKVKGEKIEVDPIEDEVEEPKVSEMPEEDELPHIKIEKLEKRVATDEEEAKPKKPRRLFKGIRKKSS